MMVIDPSLAAAWVLPDESNAVAESVLEGVVREGARVPALFWYELRNLLLMAERRKRLPPNEAEIAFARVRGLPIEERTVEDGPVFGLARRHRLTAYDAAYLALALAERLGIATNDARLAEAARREGITVSGLTP
jgi:predicted nucleic acid-binding protein